MVRIWYADAKSNIDDTSRSKSKPEVKFQYGTVYFQKTEVVISQP